MQTAWVAGWILLCGVPFLGAMLSGYWLHAGIILLLWVGLSWGLPRVARRVVVCLWRALRSRTHLGLVVGVLLGLGLGGCGPEVREWMANRQGLTLDGNRYCETTKVVNGHCPQ